MRSPLKNERGKFSTPLEFEIRSLELNASVLPMSCQWVTFTKLYMTNLVILKPLDISHSETFHHFDTIFTVDVSLQHVRNVENGAVCPENKIKLRYKTTSTKVVWKGGRLVVLFSIWPWWPSSNVTERFKWHTF